MADLGKQEAALGLQLLADAAVGHKENIENYSTKPIHSDSDEENGSECPIFESFYSVGGSTSIHSMTNMECREFQKLWDNVRNYILSNLNVGRGRKCQHKAKDVLFMTLCVLKHGGKWDFLARVFKMKGPTFERMITGFMKMLSDYVYQKLVINVGVSWTMTRLMPCKPPNRNAGGSKKNYSGKHKLYGYKVEVAVLSCGLAAFCSEHQPSSIADIDILATMVEAHQEALRKVGSESDVVDVGPLRSKFSDSWAALTDKGYQGAIELIRAIYPKKKPPNGMLTIDDEARNNDISSDRIIVKNFFGRLCGLWDVLSHKYRWSEGMYDIIFKLCVGFTNLHVMWHPLRAEDGGMYQKMKNRQYTIGEELLTKRREKQRRYRLKRKRRMDVQFHVPVTDRQTVREFDSDDTLSP